MKMTHQVAALSFAIIGATVSVSATVYTEIKTLKKRAEVAEARYAEVEKHLPRILEQVKAQGVMTGMEMGCGK